MKIPKYKDVGLCVLTPDIQEGKVRVIVNIKGSEDQSTANLNSKKLRELADYIDSAKSSKKKENTFFEDWDEAISKDKISSKSGGAK